MDNITIKSITVIENNTVTRAGEDLMRRIQEHPDIDLGCRHEWEEISDTDYTDYGPRPLCSKCGNRYGNMTLNITANPDFLTSLDALRPVWDKIENNPQFRFALYIGLTDELAGANEKLFPLSHHHVETLASILEVECTESCDKDNYKESCQCFGIRKFTVLQAWEDEWRGK